MQLVPYTPPVVTNDVAIVTTYPLEKLLSVSIPLTLLVRFSECKLGFYVSFNDSFSTSKVCHLKGYHYMIQKDT